MVTTNQLPLGRFILRSVLAMFLGVFCSSFIIDKQEVKSESKEVTVLAKEVTKKENAVVSIKKIVENKIEKQKANVEVSNFCLMPYTQISGLVMNATKIYRTETKLDARVINIRTSKEGGDRYINPPRAGGTNTS